MSNLFDIIKQDHDEVKELLDQLSELDEDEADKAGELFEELRMKFLPHVKAEESTFYASLLKKEDARQEGLEALEEHHVATMVFQELEKLDKGDERWMAKMKVFKEIVEHHIDEEEGPIFETAESALDDDEISDITGRFQSEKKRFMDQMK